MQADTLQMKFMRPLPGGWNAGYEFTYAQGLIKDAVAEEDYEKPGTGKGAGGRGSLNFGLR